MSALKADTAAAESNTQTGLCVAQHPFVPDQHRENGPRSSSPAVTPPVRFPSAAPLRRQCGYPAGMTPDQQSQSNSALNEAVSLN